MLVFTLQGCHVLWKEGLIFRRLKERIPRKILNSVVNFLQYCGRATDRCWDSHGSQLLGSSPAKNSFFFPPVGATGQACLTTDYEQVRHLLCLKFRYRNNAKSGNKRLLKEFHTIHLHCAERIAFLTNFWLPLSPFQFLQDRNVHHCNRPHFRWCCHVRWEVHLIRRYHSYLRRLRKLNNPIAWIYPNVTKGNNEYFATISNDLNYLVLAKSDICARICCLNGQKNRQKGLIRTSTCAKKWEELQ